MNSTITMAIKELSQLPEHIECVELDPETFTVQTRSKTYLMTSDRALAEALTELPQILKEVRDVEELEDIQTNEIEALQLAMESVEDDRDSSQTALLQLRESLGLDKDGFDDDMAKSTILDRERELQADLTKTENALERAGQHIVGHKAEISQLQVLHRRTEENHSKLQKAYEALDVASKRAVAALKIQHLTLLSELHDQMAATLAQVEEARRG